MAIGSSTITPCLWFDTQGEEAATFYTKIFPNSRIVETQTYGEGGVRDADMVMIVEFELDGVRFTALNGGPEFTFSEAVSFQVFTESQEETDQYSDSLIADGGEQGPCGWVKDRFGLSWQVVPREVVELLKGDGDPQRGARATAALMKMHRIDIAAVRAAADG